MTIKEIIEKYKIRKNKIKLDNPFQNGRNFELCQIIKDLEKIHQEQEKKCCNNCIFGVFFLAIYLRMSRMSLGVITENLMLIFMIIMIDCIFFAQTIKKEMMLQARENKC